MSLESHYYVIRGLLVIFKTRTTLRYKMGKNESHKAVFAMRRNSRAHLRRGS